MKIPGNITRMTMKAATKKPLPVSYTLTAPDNTRYLLDKAGRVSRIEFTDGVSWLVSDAGIASVGAETDERIDFQRDSSGRITRVVLPDAQGGLTAITYHYDGEGRLMRVRALDDTGLGSPIAYESEGQPFAETLTANLGTAIGWTDMRSSP
jgi:YD repeat-containing protein